MPFARVERILRTTTYEDLAKHWLYDFENQRVRYSYTEDDELPVLNMELRSLMQTLELRKAYFEMDAGSAFLLLTHFYGKEPSLPMITASRG